MSVAVPEHSDGWREASNNTDGEPCHHSSTKISLKDSLNAKDKASSSCAIRYLESGKLPSKEILPSISSRNNDNSLFKMSGITKDFIPLDILSSLNEIPSPPSKEQLGPPSKFKNNKVFEKQTIRKRPANVWNHVKGREKLKHLVENPPCLCGAGRDISFLYDALLAKDNAKGREKSDETKESALSHNKATLAMTTAQIPNTLVPAEFHLVKEPGAYSLEFSDDRYTTHLDSHEEHVTIFPSMKPTGRQEVLKLKHAFEAMLSRAGVEDNFKELSGPTQIHNLLELVKKEQNIYNIVFNELIRQCTIECVERGELLANLRQKYVQLLDRIPRQVMSLHQEVLAQRALDRRLTEELMRFKENVSSLTSELNAVKDHDNAITKQAEQIQQELNEALLESEKNANLLEEYHELYDLQRKRLETFVQNLSEERDIWSSATYILALKVVDHHKLNVTKRLHLHERAWSKLMTHFSLILSQKDSEQLQEVVNSFQSWKDLAEKFYKQMIKDEENLKSNLDVVVNQLLKWKKEFQKFISSDGGHVQVPEKILIEELLCDMRSWEEMCSKEGEKFTGGSLLSSQEHLILLYHKVEEWTDVAHKIFRRHTFCDRNVIYTEEMMTLNKVVEKLHQQFQIRVSGENGVAKELICISNRMESWCNKLHSVVNGGDELLESEWTRLAEQVGNEWLENMNEVKYLIGSQIKEDDRKKNDESQSSVDFNELCKLSRKWLTNMTNSIENDDGKLLQTVNDLHSTMLKWMVTVLIRLAPNLDDGELEKIDGNDNFKGALGGSEILLESTSLQIQNRRACLVDELRTYTKVMKDACTNFVMESTLEKKNRYEDDAEAECNDLKRISRECEGWVWASEVLLKQVVGELPVRGVDVEELLAKPSSDGLNKDKERSLRDLEEEAITKQDNSVKSFDLESEKETSAVTAVTTEDNDEDDKKESVSSDVTKIKVIAEDETVRTKELKHIDDVKEESTAEINDASFKALETVEKLQNELIEAEKRAQLAEQRALDAEDELKSALEKIRLLERSARDTSAQSTSSTKPPKESVTPAVPPKKPSAPSQKMLSKQQKSRNVTGSSNGRKK